MTQQPRPEYSPKPRLQRTHYLCRSLLSVPGGNRFLVSGYAAALCLTGGSLCAAENSATELDKRLAALEAKVNEKESRRSRLDIDLGFSVNLGVGTSSADNHDLEGLYAGAHDPKRRGLNLLGAEMGLSAQIDNLFVGTIALAVHGNAEAGELTVNLEDMSVRTLGLANGLELRAGYYNLEVGRANQEHEHASTFMTAPLFKTRMLGESGLQTPAIRLSYFLPVSWSSELTLGLASPDTASAVSFGGSGGGHHHHEEEEEAGVETSGVGGFAKTEDAHPLMAYGRLTHRFDAVNAQIKLGSSFVVGPNSADTTTLLLGLDGIARWNLAQGDAEGARFTLTSEYLYRFYEVPGNTGLDDLNDFHDHGLAISGVYAWNPQWSAGVRLERAQGQGTGVEIHLENDVPEAHHATRKDDPQRDDRTRISLMGQVKPSSSTRMRLQYDLDEADHQEDTAHSVWLGFDATFGAHPAHQF